MKIGLVGSGNMAAAMARGWGAARSDGATGAPSGFSACDAGSGRAERLMAELGGEALADPAAVAAASDLVVLAVKPAGLAAVAPALAGAGKPVVSVLGATPLERLSDALGDVPVVRAMPNVAVEVRRGATAYTRGANAGDELGAQVHELLACLGVAVEMEERLIDPATAIMGCAPAYVALFAEALIDAGVREGIGADLARELVTEAFAGTAALLADRDTLAVRRSVTSPGGSTAAGLEALERGAVRAAIGEAVAASLAKMRGS